MEQAGHRTKTRKGGNDPAFAPQNSARTNTVRAGRSRPFAFQCKSTSIEPDMAVAILGGI